MTNLEALQASINQDIKEPALRKALLENALDSDAAYVVPQEKAFDLSLASVYVFMVTTPNTQEGDYTLSMTDKATLANMAAAIYVKHGLPNPLKPKPKIRNRSNYW